MYRGSCDGYGYQKKGSKQNAEGDEMCFLAFMKTKANQGLLTYLTDPSCSRAFHVQHASRRTFYIKESFQQVRNKLDLK